jgi:hypothetical protein
LHSLAPASVYQTLVARTERRAIAGGVFSSPFVRL